MEIFDFSFENWYTLDIKLNWLSAAIVIVGICLFSFIWRKVRKYIGRKSIDIDEVTLGIGSGKVSLKYNYKSQEIAYKLWVELSTRKIGIEFDSENDVISEIYDSWYHFFTVARELLKELPAQQIDGSEQLIKLTEEILNKGLRPHLTKWQAKYRSWHESNKNNNGLTPQDFQKNYPQYAELENDLRQTNGQLMEYKNLMEKIAFK